MNDEVPTAMSTGAAADLARLRAMTLIRRFEERAAELYGAGKIRGFLHLCVGEEAVAVGVMRALGPDDAVVSTYREHGHALARGVAAERVMAEMYGRVEGCSRGRGGSMHLFDAATRFYGGNAIVAGGLPLAVGFALADKMRSRPNVTACLFGDGAVAEGEFHESLNLAALWRLPVLFLCENNLYAMGTALALAQSQPDLCAKARSYDLHAERVDGMDPSAVERAVRAAAANAREGRGPSFVECQTYRFRAHSMFDAELYRDKREVEAWKLRDPIAALTALLRLDGALTDEALARIEADVTAEIDAAVAFAEAGSWEPVENLTADVYATEATDAR